MLQKISDKQLEKYKKQFDSLQIDEIRYGLEVGIDITPYVSKDMDFTQMYEIREAVENQMSENDIKLIANINFNSNQMFEIRMGLSHNIDVTQYYNPDYSVKYMQKIRKSLEKEKQKSLGLDLSNYPDININDYNWDQMEQLRLGMLEKTDIRCFSNKSYKANQMRQIRLGLKKGFDISKFADLGFYDMQMKEIRLGLEDELSETQINIYAKLEFNHLQMKELRKKLLKNIA